MKIIDAFCRENFFRKHFLVPLCLCVSVVVITSCGSKPIDPRTVIPADSLVYLETSDLGKVLEAITSNPKFQELAKTKPDTSALNGIRLSIAVTGFQTSEEAVSEENAVLNFKPHFVAVAETNAWNYQAMNFAENKLGEFINDIYGGEIELVTADKHGGKYFTWTAQDGRKAFALVRGSLILFGNDESSIEKCIAVQNGESESIAKNAKVSALASDSLASGYVSKDGVAQIANIAGLSFAMGASEEGEVKSFIARVLPEVVRNSITEASWTARRLDDGQIEDSYTFSVAPDTAKVLSETIVPGARDELALERFIPKDFVSATHYNLKNLQIAWRSILLTASAKLDPVSGNLISGFSGSLFEPYGIENPEIFLSGVTGPIQTIRLDPDGEEVVAVVRIRDLELVKRALAKELNLAASHAADHTKLTPDSQILWRSKDDELAAAIREEVLIVGDARTVEKCLNSYILLDADTPHTETGPLASSNAAVVTMGSNSDPQARLVAVLTDRKNENAALIQTYTTETRFNQNGVERRTVSDFGLIGLIIARLDRDS